MQGSSIPSYSDSCHGPKTRYPGRLFMVFLHPSWQLLILSNNCFLPHRSQILVMNSCIDVSSNMYLTCNYSNFKCYCKLYLRGLQIDKFEENYWDFVRGMWYQKDYEKIRQRHKREENINFSDTQNSMPNTHSN